MEYFVRTIYDHGVENKELPHPNVRRWFVGAERDWRVHPLIREEHVNL